MSSNLLSSAVQSFLTAKELDSENSVSQELKEEISNSFEDVRNKRTIILDEI